MSGTARRVGLFLALVTLGLGLLLPKAAQASTLTELLKRQNDLQKQAEASKKKIDQKKKEASNLKDTIADLEDDIGSTESQITNTESQIGLTNQVLSQLNTEINQNQDQLNLLNQKLKQAYGTYYELSRVSPMETLIQNQSISAAVTQAQYLGAIQDSLGKDIAKTNGIMADLNAKKAQSEEQKAGLENLNKSLTNQRASLSRSRGQKSYLLSVTQGEQAKYEQLLKQLQSEVASISQDIYKKRQENGGFLDSSGNGGYIYAGESDTACNSRWDPFGFCFRQCTSYAAWKFNQIHGVPFRNTRPGSGSAYNWPNLAHDQGYQVSSQPSVGAVVSWASTYSGDIWGHVAIVESVYSANDIVVSEYNWSPPLGYSVRRINPNNYSTPRYITP